jgi:hypothetical protein
MGSYPILFVIIIRGIYVKDSDIRFRSAIEIDSFQVNYSITQLPSGPDGMVQLFCPCALPSTGFTQPVKV